MVLQNNPYVIFLVIAGLIGLANAVFAYQRRKAIGASTLVLLLLAISEWAFSYALELSSANLSAQIFWSKVEYIGITTSAVLFLIFCLEYAYQERLLTSERSLPLWIIPGVVLAMAWSNEIHNLLWTQFDQVELNGAMILQVGHGPVFWVIVIYSYIMMLAGTYLVIRRALTDGKEKRGQSWIMIIGAAVTLAGNFLYISGLSPFKSLDLTPFTMLIAGTAFSWGLLRMGLLELIPIAGEAVLESMNDGVLVVDTFNRIIYVNKAFEYYTQIESEYAVGMLAEKALAGIPTLAALTRKESTARREIIIAQDKKYPLYFDVRMSPVRSRVGKMVGHVFVLDEITERKQAERRLHVSTEDEKGNVALPNHIPLVLVYRLSDGRIVEVNRTFIMDMGYTRAEATGQTPLQLGLWTAEQRADFIRQLREGNLSNYGIALYDRTGKMKNYTISAQTSEINGDRYVVWVGQAVR